MNTVKAIGKIAVEREEYGKDTKTKHYYIISSKIQINKFIKISKEHWNIEHGLHWRLDIILDEDHSRNRKGNSIQNLSLICKIVFYLIKLYNSMETNLTMNQKMTRYISDFKNIENLIFDVIPSP